MGLSGEPGPDSQKKEECRGDGKPGGAVFMKRGHGRGLEDEAEHDA